MKRKINIKKKIVSQDKNNYSCFYHLFTIMNTDFCCYEV